MTGTTSRATAMGVFWVFNCLLPWLPQSLKKKNLDPFSKHVLFRRGGLHVHHRWMPIHLSYDGVIWDVDHDVQLLLLLVLIRQWGWLITCCWCICTILVRCYWHISILIIVANRCCSFAGPISLQSAAVLLDCSNEPICYISGMLLTNLIAWLRPAVIAINHLKVTPSWPK